MDDSFKKKRKRSEKTSWNSRKSAIFRIFLFSDRIELYFPNESNYVGSKNSNSISLEIIQEVRMIYFNDFSNENDWYFFILFHIHTRYKSKYNYVKFNQFWINFLCRNAKKIGLYSWKIFAQKFCSFKKSYSIWNWKKKFELLRDFCS